MKFLVVTKAKITNSEKEVLNGSRESSQSKR